jgi:hypothetical protein
MSQAGIGKRRRRNSAVNWKESMTEPLRPRTVFRFDQAFVPVSSIAQQYYCEEKVEQEFIHGEVPSEAKDEGTRLHEQVLEMKKVELEELIELIETAPRAITSFGLHAQIGGIDVVGVPDAVITEKARPRWLIELKTTRGDPTRLWNDQLVQARVYGLLLDRMGFDCSRLQLVLVRWRQDDIAASAGGKDAMLTRVANALYGGKTATLESEHGMKFFTFPHDRKEAESAVAWAQGYWLSSRDPVPTTIPGKCRACEFSARCPHSLANRGS